MVPSSLRGSSVADTSRPSEEHERHQGRRIHRKTRSIGDSLAWIFRTNLPPRRGAPMQGMKKRDWFGFGDVLGVMANPGDTLQQLEETRKALEKAQRELRLRSSSFSSSLHEQFFSISTPDAAIFSRPPESSALHRIFAGPPTFTVLCGASSTGKTSLLREILKDEKYYVLYLDMKIAGGAGIEGLFSGLCGTVEWLVQSMLKDLRDNDENVERIGKEGEEFEKVVRAVKLGAQELLSRLEKPSYSKLEKTEHSRVGLVGTTITTNDIARLIQLLRTALLLSSKLPARHSHSHRYPECRSGSGRHKHQAPENVADGGEITSSEETKVSQGLRKDKEKGKEKDAGTGAGAESEKRLSDEKAPAPSNTGDTSIPPRPKEVVLPEDEEKWEIIPEDSSLRTKRIPILVLDDAHKLASLTHTSTSLSSYSLQILRYLLEGLVVLSRQDRLCHVVHSTNDGLYVNWLRELGVLEGCKIITLSDAAKPQVRSFLTSYLLPSISPALKGKLESEEIFEKLYEVLGGRLAHWADFVGDWVNAGGNLPVERSNPFLQAYTALNFLLVRVSEAEADAEADAESQAELDADETVDAHDRNRACPRSRCHSRCRTRLGDRARSRSSLHLPRLHGHKRGMKSSTTLLGLGTTEDAGAGVDKAEDIDLDENIPFTVMQLLDVFFRLVSPSPSSTSTHALASTLSPTIRPVSMRSLKVMSRITVNNDIGNACERGEARKDRGISYFALCRDLNACGIGGIGGGMRAIDFLIRERLVELRWTRPLPSSIPTPASSSARDLNLNNLADSGDQEHEADAEDEDSGINELGRFGPTLHPTSPILAYAMRVVLDEYGYQPPQVVADEEDDELVDEGIGMRVGRGLGEVRDRDLGREDEDDLFYRSDGAEGRGGRESSGLSDGQSDYVSLEDVSEY